MKKLLVLLGILAAFSFVACNKEADPVNPPASDPIENPTDTPDVPDTPDTPDVPDTPAEIVLFDPANYDGEKIEIGGETFAKVTVDGYNTVISIDPIDCSACTKFTAKLAAEEDKDIFNLSVGLKDAAYADVATVAMYGLKSSPADYVKEGFDGKTDWNKVSETKVISVIQPMVQDSTAGYAPQSGVVVYIGKIIAE